MPLSAALPACSPTALAIRTGGDQGDFNGMSHSGTYLIVTNRSRRACTVPGLPSIAMRDRSGRALSIARRAPVGMHPGPIVLPVRLPPGTSVRTGLRWISGEVFDRSRCYDVASVAVTMSGRRLTTPLVAHVCAQAGTEATFDQPVLARADR